MKHLLKYLKQSKLAILFVFILLVMQAYCDLKLPEYTSNMVNVGIQQSGITSTTPKEISKETMDNLLILSNDEKILKNYTLKDGIYKLKTDKNLDDFFTNAFVINSMLTNEEISSEIKKQMNIPNSVDIYTALSNTPNEAKDKFLKEINDKLDDMGSSILTSIAIECLKEEYEKIDYNVTNIQNSYIFKTGVLMLTVAIISMILTILVAYFAAKVSALLGKNMRKDVFSNVLDFSQTEFNKFGVASLITRSTNDITQIQMLIVMMLRIVFYAPLMAIGGTFKILNTNTGMTWILALAIAVIAFLMILLFIIVMPKFKILQKLIDKVNLVARELLSGLNVVRAFSKESHEEAKFKKANTDLTKTNLFVNRTMSFMMPSLMLIMNLIMVTIVWVGAGNIDSGNMQVGDMMAFMQYTVEIVISFLMIGVVSIILPRALVSLNRIGAVLDTKSSITFTSNPRKFDDKQKGVVEFKNVSFKYPDADDNVITNISFKALPNQTTALIGSTGSGKSTVVNLIPRFFDVTEGKIEVSGVNIKDVSIHDLRDKIGFVAQKGVLFSGTVRSNIAFGKDISDEKIEKALEIAMAKEFVDKLGGIDYDISQSGKNVSGGQKQRLSIARALALDPDILVFDDSFSALDFKTDALLRENLKKNTKEKTIIIVAQRINTIMNADQIIVLDEGKIVGKGKHKDLLKTCPIYKEIALSQLSKEEL